jgi:TrmH family RNA methyltransferase
VRSLRQLHEARGRRSGGRLLLEGTHLFQEALRAGIPPREVLVTATWRERHRNLLDGLTPATTLRLATPEVLAAAATTGHPDGVVLTIPFPPPAGPPTAGSLLLVLERIQDPGNLGTLLRTALAAGVEQVWLAGGADPFQPKVLRASSGAVLTLPLRQIAPEALDEQLAELRRRGHRLVATAVPQRGGGRAVVPYWQIDWTLPTALLLGNEAAGLTPERLDGADALVTIPHAATVESLNVAVAAAPLLLERLRQTLEHDHRPAGGRMPRIPRSSSR